MQRKTKGSMEKFAHAPEPIKIFKTEITTQLRQRFFAKSPDDVTIMCLYLDPSIKESTRFNERQLVQMQAVFDRHYNRVADLLEVQ